MRCIAAIAFLVFAVALGWMHDAWSLEPMRAEQDSFISRAILDDGLLWLLSDSGDVSTVGKGSNRRRNIALPEPALALWTSGGRPMVLTASRQGASKWTIRRWEQATWKSVAEIPISEESLVAADASDTATLVLTSQRLIELAPNQFRDVKVVWPAHVPLRGIPCMHAMADRVLLGENAGEWGGGLLAIDRTTGAARAIENRSTGRRGGLLRAELDPVTGIADEPGHPGCVVVSIGLIHMLSSGRIVEVCGTTVRKVYSTKDPTLGSNLLERMGVRKTSADGIGSTPFFGVAALDNAIWAVSPSRLYQINADGSAVAHVLPKLQAVGGISVSFSDPRFVVVSTDINERHSVSGSVPILVPR